MARIDAGQSSGSGALKLEHRRLRLDQKVAVRKEDLAPGRSPIRDRYPEGGAALTIEQLLEAIVSESDNTACDLLPGLVPPPAVTGYLRQ